MVRRGPKTIGTAIKSYRFIDEPTAIKSYRFIDEPLTKGLFIFCNDEPIGYVRRVEDINALSISKNMKRKAAIRLISAAASRSPSRAKKIITSPRKQFARKLSYYLGAGGAGATGGTIVGRRRGHKKGHQEGYVTALEDVMRYNKGVKPDLSEIIDNMQKRGITLMDVKKGLFRLPRSASSKLFNLGAELVEERAPEKAAEHLYHAGRKRFIEKQPQQQSPQRLKRPMVGKMNGGGMSYGAEGAPLVREDLQPNCRKRRKLRKVEQVQHPEVQGDILRKGLIAAASRDVASLGAGVGQGGHGLKGVYSSSKNFIRNKLKPAVDIARRNRGKIVLGSTYAGGKAMNRESRNQPPIQTSSYGGGFQGG
jgi:hypothetical protein